MKLKIYKILFIILIILAVVLLGAIIFKYKGRKVNENKNKQVVEEFYNYSEKVDSTEKVKLNGYDVIGVIKIPKIQLEYPIIAIETSNPEETEEPMKFAIVRYWGGKVNDYGNLSIAGHNNYDGTMFGKTKNLENGDIIELTDENKQTISYEIYDKFKTNPNDITILKTQDTSVREVTLITCTNGNKERLILKAREIN